MLLSHSLAINNRRQHSINIRMKIPKSLESSNTAASATISESTSSATTKDSSEVSSKLQCLYMADFKMGPQLFQKEIECHKLWQKKLVEELRKSLFYVLADDWLQRMKECISELPESSTMVKKGILEVGIEFLQLIEPSAKPIKEKIQKLIKYYEFYGNQVVDVEGFTPLVEELFSSNKKIIPKIEGYKRFEESIYIKQTHKRYRDLQRIYNDTKHEKCVTKSKKFVFGQHIVTALLIADVTTSKKTDSEKISDVIQAMKELTIDDQLASEEELKLEPKKVRTRTEQEQQVGSEIFSAGLLNAIFTYIDYETAEKPRTMKSTSIGKFIVVVLEINTNSLSKIHKALGMKNKHDQTIIRVIQLYQEFYSVLYQTILKFGLHYLLTVTKEDFNNAVKRQLKEYWKEEMIKPTEFFLYCGKMAIKDIKDLDERKFFEAMRMKLMQGWERDIVEKSRKHKKPKFDSTVETKEETHENKK